MKVRRRTDLGLFALLFLAAAYVHHPVEYDNTASRYYLVSAVVDYGTLNIDRYETIDASEHGGHRYSNKAIGAPLLAVPVYWALRRATPIRHDAPLSRRAMYLVRIFTTTAPFALTGVVLFRLLISVGAAPPSAFAAVLAYAFGTIAWIHAAMFSGHQLAASSAFFSFAAVRHLAREGAGVRNLPGWFGAGILAGFATLTDYTAVGISVVLVLYALSRARHGADWISFWIGAALCAVPLALYNLQCFGSPWSMSYSSEHLGYGTFSEGARKGILGVGAPSVESILSLLFSPARGVFFIMPVLLTALPGLAVLRSRPGLKPECLLVCAAVLACFLVAAGFYGWHGGWTFGPRYLVPMLPFLAVPMAFAFDRIWTPVLGLVSFLQVGFAQICMPHTPEKIQNPLVECILPLFQYGYRPLDFGHAMGLSGWPSLVPLGAALACLVWVLRRWVGQDFIGIPAESSSSAWRPVYGLAAASILLGIFTVRTPDSRLVPVYRTRLLQHAAYELKSEPLAAAAYREHQLSKGVP
ncbi:hypothetical protein HY522_10440 [bacterium]|nr:hypothetical protein [bacterium]